MGGANGMEFENGGVANGKNRQTENGKSSKLSGLFEDAPKYCLCVCGVGLCTAMALLFNITEYVLIISYGRMHLFMLRLPALVCAVFIFLQVNDISM